MTSRQKPRRVDLLTHRRGTRGFTLIELIMVIVLLGVLAVFAAPRIFNTGDFYSRGFHDQTLAYLRYAQKTAIAQRRTVCVTFSATTVNLAIASTAATNTCGPALLGPSGAQLTSRSGVTFNGIPGAFNFDGLGQPRSTAGAGALLGGQSIQVVGASQGITVEAVTGYIHD